MVIRRGRRIDLSSEVCLPAGLALDHADGADVAAALAQVQLEPEDLVLFFTDGVVESRSDTGEEFGRERLGALVQRAVAAGQTVAETMRLLGRAVVAHQPRELQDDASLVGLAWHGPA
jgi:serine phosphatase RsbU (regulator of sigma subunit)